MHSLYTQTEFAGFKVSVNTVFLHSLSESNDVCLPAIRIKMAFRSTVLISFVFFFGRFVFLGFFLGFLVLYFFLSFLFEGKK